MSDRPADRGQEAQDQLTTWWGGASEVFSPGRQGHLDRLAETDKAVPDAIFVLGPGTHFGGGQTTGFETIHEEWTRTPTGQT